MAMEHGIGTWNGPVRSDQVHRWSLDGTLEHGQLGAAWP